MEKAPLSVVVFRLTGRAISLTIHVAVEVGYDTRTCALTKSEWAQVSKGLYVTKDFTDWYEGEEFIYTFQFNSEQAGSLLVFYTNSDGECFGDGFTGQIDDALISRA